MTEPGGTGAIPDASVQDLSTPEHAPTGPQGWRGFGEHQAATRGLKVRHSADVKNVQPGRVRPSIRAAGGRRSRETFGLSVVDAWVNESTAITLAPGTLKPLRG